MNSIALAAAADATHLSRRWRSCPDLHSLSSMASAPASPRAPLAVLPGNTAEAAGECAAAVPLAPAHTAKRPPACDGARAILARIDPLALFAQAALPHLCEVLQLIIAAPPPLVKPAARRQPPALGAVHGGQAPASPPSPAPALSPSSSFRPLPSRPLRQPSSPQQGQATSSVLNSRPSALRSPGMQQQQQDQSQDQGATVISQATASAHTTFQLARGLLAHLLLPLQQLTDAPAADLPYAGPVLAAVLANNKHVNLQGVPAVQAETARQAFQLLAEIHGCIWQALQQQHAEADLGDVVPGAEVSGVPSDDTNKDEGYSGSIDGESQNSTAMHLTAQDTNADADTVVLESAPSRKRVKLSSGKAQAATAQQRHENLLDAVKQHMAEKQVVSRWLRLLPHVLSPISSRAALAHQHLLFKLVRALIEHTVRYRVQAVLDTLAQRRQQTPVTAGYAADTHTVVRQLAHYIVVNDYLTLQAYVHEHSRLEQEQSQDDKMEIAAMEDDARQTENQSPAEATVPTASTNTKVPAPRSELERRRSMLLLLKGLVDGWAAAHPDSHSLTEATRAAALRSTVIDVSLLRLFHVLESAVVKPAVSVSRKTKGAVPLPAASEVVQQALVHHSVNLAWQSVITRSGERQAATRPLMRHSTDRAVMLATLTHRYYTLRLEHEAKVHRLSQALRKD